MGETFEFPEAGCRTEVEGTHLGYPHKPPLTPGAGARRKHILLALAVALAVVVAGVSLYVLTRPPPIPLTVTDGSTSGVVFGDFEHYSDTSKPLWFYFDATSVARTSGGRSSTLELRVSAGAFYDGDVFLFPDSRVHGRFASGVSVTGLTLAFNETGYLTGAKGNPYGIPNPVNVSSNPLMPGVRGMGSSSVSPTLSNRTGGNPDYVLAWTASIEAGENLTQNAFFGVRATVTWDFAPSVSVGIVLHLVDVPPGGTPPPRPSGALGMTVAQSPDGTNSTATLTPVPGRLLNTTTDLDLGNDTAELVVPLGPLGGLYASPYRTSVAYLPAIPGSSQVGAGDRVVLSSATHPTVWWVEFSTGGLRVLWGLLWPRPDAPPSGVLRLGALAALSGLLMRIARV